MSNIRIEIDGVVPWPKDASDTTPEELHRLLLDRGLMSSGEEVLYLSGYRGGQVNPKVGEYVFNCQAIYRMKDGATTLHEPAIFSGKVLSTLGAIRAGIGDPVIDRLGTCGKQGQSVPSSGGGPAFTLIEPCQDAVIGGRSEK
jgi:TldD protein